MFKSLKKSALTLLATTSILLAFVTVGIANAAQIDYNDPNNQPISTPRFNGYTNVPGGIGDESNFVTLRKSSGDPTVPAIQNNFIDPVNATCNAGEKFDIRAYIHNIANTEFNDNGNGTAVAKNVKLTMSAPIGQKSKKFTFASTVSASNAASVSDTGMLNCTNEVRLKLVPQTVKVYSQHTGWTNGLDSAVNGTMPIGSRVAGSGTQWGCWEDRVIVVYTVEVEAQPTPIYTCDAITAEKIGERKYRFGVRYTANNGATLKSVKYNFGDNTSQTITTSPFSTEYDYAKAGEYKITTDLTFTVEGQDKVVTDAKCATTVKTSDEPCLVPGKQNYPKDSPECKEDSKPPVTEIPSTGVGGILAGLTGITSVAYSAYTYYESRRSLKGLGSQKNILK